MAKYTLGVDPVSQGADIANVSAKITEVSVIGRDKVVVVTSDDLTPDEEKALVTAVNLIVSSILRTKGKASP